MPITAADLRGMLRADAVGLVLGLLLILTALATLVLVSVLRRRAVSLLWLGAFALLYGSRSSNAPPSSASPSVSPRICGSASMPR